jgi:signal transduction histidine kinase
MLHDFLVTNRAAIIARTRAKVAARVAPCATDEELESGVPLFLDQLVERLRSPNGDSDAIAADAGKHGRALLKRGFSVGQVVHDYGGLCQAVTELAGELAAPIGAEEFHTFNGCLDNAIAAAVSEYGRTREQAITAAGTERLGSLAHELRNALGAAMLSFQSLKAGNVGVGGSTAALLGRSLRRLSVLIDSSIARVRLESATMAIERVSMQEFIEEIEVGATMEADARSVALSVAPVPLGVDVAVDRQLLAGAVVNLLQNAFKFTRPGGHVSLRTTSNTDSVIIEVEDECGGLGPRKLEELFRPFEQRAARSAGLGLGLSISRRSIDAMGGQIRVRDLPGVGCIFTIDLPRVTAPAV